LCPIRPAAPGDEGHRRLRARRISLLGGTGTLLGAFLGAFFTQIDTVLVLFRLPAWWNDFIAGLVLLGVLVLDGGCAGAGPPSAGAEAAAFSPATKGASAWPRFPNAKTKRWAQ
jgi:AI-2 transport system permease protein